MDTKDLQWKAKYRGKDQ